MFHRDLYLFAVKSVLLELSTFCRVQNASEHQEVVK